MPDATPALSAHDAAMVAKVDAVHNATVAQTTPASQLQAAPEGAPKVARPDHIPEKFWDAEKGVVRTDELAKSYAELESKAGKPATPETPEVPPEAADPLKAAQAKGVDVASMQAEFSESGSLSEASYKALADAGFGKDVVDAYIEGQNALAEKAVNTAYTLVGGEDTYKSILQWAGTSLNPAEVKAFNDAIMNPSLANTAILGLKARFEAAAGSEPQLLSGAQAPSAGATPFASRAEVTAAMRDPRYTNDPAYRAMVAKRLDAMEVF